MIVEKEAADRKETSGRDSEEGRVKAGKKVEFLPSKMGYTRKLGPLGGRLKARWVASGNFEERRSNEDTYSSGADASACRLLAATVAHFQWQGGTVDIKTAFLNAEMEAAEGESIITIKPPMAMLEKKFLPPKTVYLPLKAVYGFRRSPRLWGNCLDRALIDMRIPGEDGKGSDEKPEFKALNFRVNWGWFGTSWSPFTWKFNVFDLAIDMSTYYLQSSGLQG